MSEQVLISIGGIVILGNMFTNILSNIVIDYFKEKRNGNGKAKAAFNGREHCEDHSGMRQDISWIKKILEKAYGYEQ